MIKLTKRESFNNFFDVDCPKTTYEEGHLPNSETKHEKIIHNDGNSNKLLHKQLQLLLEPIKMIKGTTSDDSMFDLYNYYNNKRIDEFTGDENKYFEKIAKIKNDVLIDLLNQVSSIDSLDESYDFDLECSDDDELNFISLSSQMADECNSEMSCCYNNGTKLTLNRFILSQESMNGTVSSEFQYSVECNEKCKIVKSNDNRFNFGLKLGQGKFGCVYSAYDKKRKEIVAVKMIKYDFEGQVREILNEMTTFQDVKCENLTELYDYEIYQKVIWLTMEYCGNNSSLETFRRENGEIPELVVADFTTSLLNAVSNLHENRIIHRDIKTANILLKPIWCQYEKYVIKLCDFGCAVRFNEMTSDQFTTGMAGTCYIMAPEVILSSTDKTIRYNYKADIWSVGCTVLELLSGKRVWDKLNDEQIIIKMTYFKTRPSFPENISEKAVEFLKCCLDIDPEKRFDAKFLLQHEFLK